MKARKKPTEVDFWRITGNPKTAENPVPQWVMEAYAYNQTFKYYRQSAGLFDKGGPYLVIGVVTPKGFVRCELGDYLIKEANGDLHPCKPDFFRETYDILEE